MGVHISKVLCYHLLYEESASRKHCGGAWQVSIRLRVAGHPTTEAGQNMVCIEAIEWTKHYTVRLTKLQDERRTARAQHTIHFTQRRRQTINIPQAKGYSHGVKNRVAKGKALRIG